MPDMEKGNSGLLYLAHLEICVHYGNTHIEAGMKYACFSRMDITVASEDLEPFGAEDTAWNVRVLTIRRNDTGLPVWPSAHVAVGWVITTHVLLNPTSSRNVLDAIMFFDRVVVFYGTLCLAFVDFLSGSSC